ncbi:hypothetical protein [Streptomyces sp. RP5T]|uniref:hypothetical protein n=1 Tax=Streptomyces sp. RP5T TaxID=2490848 RepID=UPI000F6518BE|nr:hypothetical protein [Streptomyces sp. RP5T]RRR87038.1 hypothetical protein EHS43_02310 [Streptomyces sp. RP5T]
MRAVPPRILVHELEPVGGAAQVLDGEAGAGQSTDAADPGDLAGSGPPSAGRSRRAHANP